MELTKEETKLLVNALKRKKFDELTLKDHWLVAFKMNNESWTTEERTKVQETIEKSVFTLNTLDRMIKSIEDGEGITCYS